jgi:hypothetical protein
MLVFDVRDKLKSKAYRDNSIKLHFLETALDVTHERLEEKAHPVNRNQRYDVFIWLRIRHAPNEFPETF